MTSNLLDNLQHSAETQIFIYFFFTFFRASIDLEAHKVLLTDWSKFTNNLDNKNIILAPFCGDSDCEDKIKADSTR